MSDVEYDYSEDDDYYNFDEYNYDKDEDDDDEDEENDDKDENNGDEDEDDDKKDEDNDDGFRMNGHRVEDLEDIKDYKRGIMIAERKVHDHVARLGCTVFKQKGMTVTLKAKAGQFVYCWKRKKTTMEQQTRKTTMKQLPMTS